MNDNELVTKVLTACGWTLQEFKAPNTEYSRWIRDDGRWMLCSYANSILTSLDACRDVFESSLTEAEKSVYAEALCAILDGEPVDWGYYPGEAYIDWNAIAGVVTATAAQRCKAFLTVKGVKL